MKYEEFDQQIREMIPRPSATITAALYRMGVETLEGRLQEILIARGFKGKNGKTLTLSRKADENTIYALTQYQKSRNGVLVVDGACGENTWKDLIAI